MTPEYGFGKIGRIKIPGPYGTNVGDIWTMKGSEVSEHLKRENNLIGIVEVFRHKETGEPEERIYSVELDNPRPEMQDLIARARRGDELRLAARAAQN